MKRIDNYDFYKTKYGIELLIDLIPLENLEKYIINAPSHTLTYYDITLITNGTGLFYLDGNQFDIKPGTVFFSSPMQVRKWEIDKVPLGKVLIFEEDFLCEFFNDNQFVQKLSFFNNSQNTTPIVLNGDKYSYFLNILNTIESEIITRESKDNHILRSLLYQALVWLNRTYKQKNPVKEKKADTKVLQFRKLVDKNFTEEHSVKFYAKRLNITPGYLNDLVNLNMGISAKQIIQNRIFLEARRLLTYSSLTVSEIAWRLNFQDDSYFIRAFKKNNGCTPQTFRKNVNP